MKKRDPIDEEDRAINQAALLKGRARQTRIAERITAAIPTDESDEDINVALSEILHERLRMRANRESLNRWPELHVK